jgi:hypothetical protein
MNTLRAVGATGVATTVAFSFTLLVSPQRSPLFWVCVALCIAAALVTVELFARSRLDRGPIFVLIAGLMNGAAYFVVLMLAILLAVLLTPPGGYGGFGATGGLVFALLGGPLVFGVGALLALATLVVRKI